MENTNESVKAYEMLRNIYKQQIEHDKGLGGIGEILSLPSLDEKASGIYQYAFLVDEKKHTIIVRDMENNNQCAYPFGYEVMQTVNMVISCDTESVAGEMLNNSPDFTESEKKDLRDFYNKNKLYIQILYDFLFNLSNYETEKKISFYNAFQFFQFNDWFHTVESTGGSSLYQSARHILQLICEYHIIRQYQSWTYNNDVYTGWAYFCPTSEYWFTLDLFQLVINDCGANLRKCDRCGRLYIATHGKSKYCPFCKDNYDKIRQEARKRNVPRYLHKRVQDKLHQRGMDTAAFINESNYYWDIVRKKVTDSTPPALPHYRKSIKTEKQYIDWLQKKLKE